MSDFIPKAGPVKVGGLSRAAQKLQAAREKAAQAKTGGKSFGDGTASSIKTKGANAPAKKVSFQRKAV